nr:hypothetical protein [Flavobacterium album]
MFAFSSHAQDEDQNFWSHVRFGGNIGVGFGSGYTDILIAPGAIYQFNDYMALGAGLQGAYVYQRDYYSSKMYGGSVIGILNPLPQIQLSAELEQLRVNLDYDDKYYQQYMTGSGIPMKRDFWNTALFFGAGYRMDNVTIGMRYNVLYKERDLVYSNAFMPFVRVYF